MTDYSSWFQRTSGHAPHPWQADLAADPTFRDRVLRIPTGFGKTDGTILAWLFHRVVEKNEAWPRRLVFCLPMRVLVEQTEREVLRLLEAAGLADAVRLSVLLGGREAAAWVDAPDVPQIIVGTQDMLLSRALNRGYGSGRALWPMEFGSLHSDALWVVDEVQLMDVGLTTTTQLAAFRAFDTQERTARRPAATWWMSATLQLPWLDSVDFVRAFAAAPPPLARIPAEARVGGLWAVEKGLEVRADVSSPEEIAQVALDAHQPGSLTLVVVNTVDRAVKAFAELEKLAKKRKASFDRRLVHSRFRGAERADWDFLRRGAPAPAEGRIVVATQVVEAGVDISAATLVSDLAPWPSLVQRIGRCARYAGESGRVVIAGGIPADDRKAAPYTRDQLVGSASALERLLALGKGVAPSALEQAEDAWAVEEPAFVRSLYPYEPLHVLRRRDFDDLFDTSPDLSGADLDVGRYIRASDDRDVSLFWRDVDDLPKLQPPPSRSELCAAPVPLVRDWQKKAGIKLYAFDFVDGEWARVDRPVVPGMVLLADARAGGYEVEIGLALASTKRVPVVPTAPAKPCELVDAASSDENETLSATGGFKSIASHVWETAGVARTIAGAVALPAGLSRALELAARWHDVGKAHPAFQAAILSDARTAAGGVGQQRDLAKAPRAAWDPKGYRERPGFRHELASTLLLFEVLRRRDPTHAALLGPYAELLALMGETPTALTDEERLAAHPLADELAALDADMLNLVAYLVCSHHGKVRTSWTSTPHDQERDEDAIHGVRSGDELPAFDVPTAAGERCSLPSTRLSLDLAALGLGTRFGASWTDRVARLLALHGPFALAYLETLLRTADWRASALTTGEVL